jgi:hypothetical protein
VFSTQPTLTLGDESAMNLQTFLGELPGDYLLDASANVGTTKCAKTFHTA